VYSFRQTTIASRAFELVTTPARNVGKVRLGNITICESDGGGYNSFSMDGKRCTKEPVGSDTGSIAAAEAASLFHRDNLRYQTKPSREKLPSWTANTALPATVRCGGDAVELKWMLAGDNVFRVDRVVTELMGISIESGKGIK
jgi:hypothetical protein